MLTFCRRPRSTEKVAGDGWLPMEDRLPPAGSRHRSSRRWMFKGTTRGGMCCFHLKANEAAGWKACQDSCARDRRDQAFWRSIRKGCTRAHGELCWWSWKKRLAGRQPKQRTPFFPITGVTKITSPANTALEALTAIKTPGRGAKHWRLEPKRAVHEFWVLELQGRCPQAAPRRAEKGTYRYPQAASLRSRRYRRSL